MTQGKDASSGALRDDQSRLMFEQGFSFSGYERDPLYLSLEGRRFLDISGVSGIDSISDGRASVFADFDNDGDLDVFMTTIQGEAHLLFRNNVGRDGHHLRVTLEGRQSGRDAFGAVARVRSSAGTLTKIKSGGIGFMSQHDPRLLFGLGRDETARSVEVTWPSGKTESFGDVPANASIRLVEGRGEIETLAEEHGGLPDPLSKQEALLASVRIHRGATFPDVTVAALDGRSARLSKLLPKGKRTLLNLWATWCFPCRREMPALKRLSPALRERGIEVVGLSVDTASSKTIESYLEEHEIDYPILWAGSQESLGRLFTGEEITVPVTFLLDESRQVLDVSAGWSKHSLDWIEALAATSPAN